MTTEDVKFICLTADGVMILGVLLIWHGVCKLIQIYRQKVASKINASEIHNKELELIRTIISGTGGPFR